MNGNIYDLFRSHWAVALDRHFLVPELGAPTTYREIDARAGQFASVLRTLGVAPGDRVVVQVAKTVDGVALYLGCLRVGAVYVPLNTSYTAREVEGFLDDASPALFVHEADRAVAGARTTIEVTELSSAATAVEPWTEVETRLADDLAAMVYTSGTTGRSKGAMLTHANLTSNALSLHAIWRFTPGDVLLHVLPIYHVHGLFVALHTAMLNASTVLFCERFDPASAISRLPEATVMMGVPTHYHRLLEQPEFTGEVCANMRLFTSGSAPMTEATHEAFTERTGHEILERYGMTETGMITSNPYEGARVPGTVGFPLPAVRVRTIDSEGLPCSPGALGVVEVKGPNVFAGYWRLPERTEAEHHDGWFVTGDIGSVDGEGRLSLEGRVGDMIISGGLNIYPKEIELALDSIDGIVESAVVGVPDTDLGERTVGVLVTDPNFMLDASALQAQLRDVLAPFKVPKAYVIVDELPRNSMGKVQKVALRSDTRVTEWSGKP